MGLFKCKTCKGVDKYDDPWNDNKECFQCQAMNHFHQLGTLTMTPDDLYNQGYEDGKAGKAMNASQLTEMNYTMGYEDGKGDRVIERPVEDEYVSFTDAPEGFEYAGMKRVPLPYEFYLSKGGSATFLTRERKNNQERHILKCATCKEKSSLKCPHHNIKGRG